MQLSMYLQPKSNGIKPPILRNLAHIAICNAYMQQSICLHPSNNFGYPTPNVAAGGCSPKNRDFSHQWKKMTYRQTHPPLSKDAWPHLKSDHFSLNMETGLTEQRLYCPQAAVCIPCTQHKRSGYFSLNTETRLTEQRIYTQQFMYLPPSTKEVISPKSRKLGLDRCGSTKKMGKNGQKWAKWVRRSGRKFLVSMIIDHHV